MSAYATAIYLPFKDVGADLIVQKSGSQAANPPAGAIRLPFGEGIFSKDEISEIINLDHVETTAKALTIWQFDKGKFISIEGLEPDSFVGDKLKSSLMNGRFLKSTSPSFTVLS